MKTSDFNYVLPQELIAQKPADRRDGARMMVLDRVSQTIDHHQFTDLPDFLCPQDLVILNNTRVVPARIQGRKKESGGAVELFFLERIEGVAAEDVEVWEVLLKSSRRPKPGQLISIDNTDAEVQFLEDLGRGKARVSVAEVDVLQLLDDVGHPPPPSLHSARRRST